MRRTIYAKVTLCEKILRTKWMRIKRKKTDRRGLLMNQTEAFVATDFSDLQITLCLNQDSL